MKIISAILILVSAFLSVKHGWDAFRPASIAQAKMMADLSISKAAMPYVGSFSIIVGLTLLLPQTFLVSNILNAITIVLIMAMSLNTGNYKIALPEIPFLALPMILIWLGHPLKN